MVSNPGKGIGLHPLQGVEGEVEGGQAGQAAEGLCSNYVPQLRVELDDVLSWLFTNRLSSTRCMKVTRMGITEILRRIWLFS